MRANKVIPGIAFIAAMLIQSCSRGPLPETPLRAAGLPADTFSIRSDRDTTVQTSGGARLQIPAGSLQAESGLSARLIVREAYTPGRMLRGGLATLSGSDIMSAGSAVQLQPGPGTKKTLSKPIRISLPASVLKEGMQFWTDTADRHRRIMWDLPQNQGLGTPLSLNAFRWFGTGTLIKDLPGFDNCQVLATFTGAEKDGISVYLVMPESGIVLEGGPAISGSGSYAFYRNDGTVPLRTGRPAVVVGVKKSGDKWLFAMKPFAAKQEQELSLELKPIDKSTLDHALDGIGQ